MNGARRIESVAYARNLDEALAVPGTDAMRVAEDFFGLSDLVKTELRLSRGLTDPARSDDDKKALVDNAFGSHVQPATAQVMKALVSAHWSKPSDICEAFEVLGILAVLTDAQRNGALDTVETALFDVIGVLSTQRDLRKSLSNMGPGNAHERGDLATVIFGHHLDGWTMRLVRRAVGRSSHGRLLVNLRRFAQWSAALRERLLVSVESARALSAEQITRLRTILTKRFGQEISLAVSINPDVVGGFRIVTGTTSIDATLSTRMTDLRRRLAG